MKFGVFISYDHADAALVDLVYPFIQGLRKDLVFQDHRNLKAGKQWQSELLNALMEAEVVIVFWCKHSAKSKFVKKEYKLAIDSHKDVMPVLLDSTRLNRALSTYQYIDFRNVIFHKESPYPLETGESHEPAYDVISLPYDVSGGIDELVDAGFMPSYPYPIPGRACSENADQEEMRQQANLLAIEIIERINQKIPKT